MKNDAIDYTNEINIMANFRYKSKLAESNEQVIFERHCCFVKGYALKKVRKREAHFQAIAITRERCRIARDFKEACRAYYFIKVS